MNRTIYTALPLVLLLGACGNDAAGGDEANAGAGARGEVLGGSISDDMIPIDTLKSRAPAMKATAVPTASSTDGAASGAGDEAGEGEGAAAPEAEPADETVPELPED